MKSLGKLFCTIATVAVLSLSSISVAHAELSPDVSVTAHQESALHSLMAMDGRAGGTEAETAVIDGHEYGPEDGVNVVTESFAVTPGGGPVGKIYADPVTGMSPMTVWGTSYAFSREMLYTEYKGVGKAAANVYNGERIVKVCFWWTRGGARVSGTTCSNATSNGYSWQSGPEVLGFAKDSLDSYAPQTIFNIQTTRINPNVT